MKKSIKTLNILLLLVLFSCANINSNKQKDIFLSEFFNTESVYNSLINYYSNKSIVAKFLFKVKINQLLYMIKKSYWFKIQKNMELIIKL